MSSIIKNQFFWDTCLRLSPLTAHSISTHIDVARRFFFGAADCLFDRFSAIAIATIRWER
jgi:hypothetical protein